MTPSEGGAPPEPPRTAPAGPQVVEADDWVPVGQQTPAAAAAPIPPPPPIVWRAVRGYVAVALGWPIALLVFGSGVYWVVAGFRSGPPQ